MGNIAININNPVNAAGAGKQAKGASAGLKAVSAGGINTGSGSDTLIDQKKQLAKKQAMKLISNAFSKDQRVADSKDKLSAKKSEKVKELLDSGNEKRSLDEQIAALKEEYEIEPDSQEQQDLDLLVKYQSYRNHSEHYNFTQEERERLSELQKTERTEYQARVLKLNDQKDIIKKGEKDLEKEIKGLSESITDIGIEQLKSKDMLNATDAAEQIMEAANKETIGMLINDAKENVDEKAEEAKENGEKLAEEKEKFEERLEEQRERRREEKEIIENFAKVDADSTEVNIKTSDNNSVEMAQRKINRIMSDNYMLDEDIMGLKIDLGF